MTLKFKDCLSSIKTFADSLSSSIVPHCNDSIGYSFFLAIVYHQHEITSSLESTDKRIANWVLTRQALCLHGMSSPLNPEGNWHQKASLSLN